MTRLRYAIIGTGSRAQMYLDAIATTHADVAELVAWSDTNPGRLDWSRAQHPGLGTPARFDTDDIAGAVRAHAIDRVIVTTPDVTHAHYVVAALEAGADAIVEKPLTTTADGLRSIADAAERTGRSVTVTFNYRYSPRNAALKNIVASGEIGEVTSVDFSWMLDTSHGADYFRRWHRDKSTSGGLLIHKSSHHFDLVGWWLDDVASRVFASGGLRFYGADNAAARGLGERPDRGSADSSLSDRFTLDMRNDDKLRGLYLDQEHHDGYLRDRDVFSGGITIEDNLALIVDYARGATMSYSLNAHSPWEGYIVAINGTQGRAELTVVERGATLAGDGKDVVVDPSATPDDVTATDTRPEGERLVVQKHFSPAEEIPIPRGEGGHGGGDAKLLHDVFVGTRPDPLGFRADWSDGARSVVVGLAGNRSLADRVPVTITELNIGPATKALSPAEPS
ncbi:Gfo/Idh/MocA family protein [Microbacterium amylolyticum]|uniref:Dehydrogenase n=1 Tax=Microbacterium amylolyticum TaxID=936337 RepID=A0ABS4ZK24_9MICO|nr:Gfo/Idh/MocA family oxidoreductase [Microbacterium amylolyticum]MBP2437634.1 putative dehydrogenase [Microbacterium amylolyticum]